MRLGRRQDPGDEAIAELRRLGADALADDVESHRPSDDFEIQGERAWGSMRLFLAASTQWRVQIVAGLKGSRVLHLGLDYTALEAIARMARIDITPDAFDDLQTMETVALAILNEHR
ncbi:DUF1799 domain-containing protein [Thalassobaculum sp.]|uniref:DUF1799 domain-containing protein n=1 Tax=Thalassobaculum sp. TaxID=2022740 RepID=UPI0032EEF1DB